MSNLDGIWNSRYLYSGGESAHKLELQIIDARVSAKSLPNEEGSELTLNLQRDENLLSGTWREATSPTGEYKGKIFEGLVAFILNEENSRAEGQWIGHNRTKTKIKSGSWSLEKSLEI